ncbi:hypothetical protein HAX54_014286 [Datura stramonium]|uniref:Glutaredoxin domain-containing protein n=1 Tax=Datura stramonium TaxID=4076 RepID=A0ABS8TPX6_DATST|nr:hypothetical protein [Datura stramonium]
MRYETESWNGYVAVVEEIERMASRNAVVIFSNNTCCMCHAIKRLLCGMGVNPTVVPLLPSLLPKFKLNYATASNLHSLRTGSSEVNLESAVRLEVCLLGVDRKTK